MNEKLYGFKETPITYILVALNVVAFILCEIFGSTLDSEFMFNHGAMNNYYVLHTGEFYRLFSSMFLHFGIEHLLNNMLLLTLLGTIFERAVGHTRYAAIYISSGLAGGMLSFIWNLVNNRNVTAAGASGAIFGIVGGMIVVIVVHKGRYEGISIKRMLLMAALTLYFGFATMNVDNAGHVGGLICGILLTFLLYGIPYILAQFKAKREL